MLVSGNYEFRLDEWRERLPFVQACPSRGAVCSPAHVIEVENVRQAVLHGQDGIPADVFVMALGEPADRGVSKIGGLPFRPKSAPWPTGPDGPLTFLCQFRFVESRDILPFPVGDLLLIFYNRYFENPDDIYCEWRSLNETELVDDLPEEPWKRVVCHGFRHRSHDRVGDHEADIGRLATLLGEPEFDRFSKFRRWRGFKIGGLHWMLEHPLPYRQLPDLSSTDLVCGISSFAPASDGPFPWINQSTPIGMNERHRDDLQFYALGGFSIFIFRNRSDGSFFLYQDFD